jgi:DNA-binding transcriptional regulator YdaS (Cro superfamily)
MRTDEAVEVFGSKNALAEAIGISPSAVYQWGSEVPMSRRQSVRLAMRVKAEEMERDAKTLRLMAQED